MFGGYNQFVLGPTRPKSAAEIPPPTPVNLPQCRPQAPEPHPASGAGSGPGPGSTNVPLNTLLQGFVRPPDATIDLFTALGVHLTSDAPLAALVPDSSHSPDFAAWDAMPYEEARDIPVESRPILNNGNKAPGPQNYLDRCRELSIENTSAFRSIRRIPAPPGQPPVRLGNAYEFYRNLEAMASYWDDTSKPPPPEKLSDGDTETKNDKPTSDTAASDPVPEFCRSGSGTNMPAEFRTNALTALIKLIAYDFGCSVYPSRLEPRLYLNTAASPSIPTNTTSPNPPTSSPSSKTPPRRISYFPSPSASFIFRSPTTREASRAGIMDGPVAAVLPRHTTSFPSPSDPTHGTDNESIIDLCRELLAALVAAQHRAREGRVEARIGETAWWATKPRWGGGEGGPIGREVQHLEKMALEDAKPAISAVESNLPAEAVAQAIFEASQPAKSDGDTGGRKKPLSSPKSSSAPKKRKKKTLPMYDSYRMIRPPSLAWDKRVRYERIGRPDPEGCGYDDIYVMSALFHHVSVVRVRVPTRLLEVLDGANEGGEVRSWGRVEVYRSRWFDLFKIEDRIEAVRVLWCVMAYMMRGKEKEGGGDKDVVMNDGGS